VCNSVAHSNNCAYLLIVGCVMCTGAGSPVLIHSNVGDLLHSLDSPGPNMYNSPKLVALNREGNIVVSYEKGGICLFTVNGKLLCDISHSESIQVLTLTSSHCLGVCLSIHPFCPYIHLFTVSFSPIVYVAAKATYIRLLHGKISILEGFFGPSSVHRGRTHIVLRWNM